MSHFSVTAKVHFLILKYNVEIKQLSTAHFYWMGVLHCKSVNCLLDLLGASVTLC